MALQSSQPEGLHLRLLPEPCLNLSIHTAPDVRPLARANDVSASMRSSLNWLAHELG